MRTALSVPSGIMIQSVPADYAAILTPEALEFLADLARRFEPTRTRLLARRAERQKELDRGTRPDFLADTRTVRGGDWSIAPFPAELADRRVEITGPAERKMIINALNSGANVFMADFEDSLTPTWDNLIQGQINLRDAADRTIRYVSPEGKEYHLNSKTALLFVRPRGWHLIEKHMLVDGHPISASLFDFGLYFFHNAKILLNRGTTPYFYLPKMESHLEARLWNDVFVRAQEWLEIPRGTIKATVLIETILAAFEMDEILYELREHSAGLNCGRWDYLFSCIKKFRADPDFVLADRGLVTMTAPFMHAYSLLAIKTCHRRNAHAIGGMAPQIPIKDDPAANEAALAKVRVDKEREATDGHDGTWVAHPGLVPLAKEVFDRIMPAPNQIRRQRDDVRVAASDLLAFAPQTPITEAGVRLNIEVGIEYLGAWLGGLGCVPIHHLMEDAATAEISRSQVWHWVHSNKGVLADGRKLTLAMVRAMIPQELQRIRQSLGETAFAAGKYEVAAGLFDKLVSTELPPEFLTVFAYDYLD
ncbi:MAG TPA: malate synthase A [Candidatus Methylomirabilis sp.]|nr:malate synthase A [Candidatus Methylomirabilis sp.]